MLKVIELALREAMESDQVTDQVTDQVKALMGVLFIAGNQAFGTKQLMEQLHLKHRPGFRKSYLLPAIENGWVAMSHPDSPNSPKQTYRLSTKGRAMAESLQS